MLHPVTVSEAKASLSQVLYAGHATKWELDKVDALRKLFTVDAWLSPALTQLTSDVRLDSRGCNKLRPSDDES